MKEIYIYLLASLLSPRVEIVFEEIFEFGTFTLSFGVANGVPPTVNTIFVSLSTFWSMRFTSIMSLDLKVYFIK